MGSGFRKSSFRNRGRSMRHGYARVSSKSQDYQAQVEALKAAKCDRIYSEKASAKSTNGRREFDKIGWLDRREISPTSCTILAKRAAASSACANRGATPRLRSAA